MNVRFVIGITIIIVLIATIVVTTSTLPSQDIGSDNVSIVHNTFLIDASVVISGEAIIVNSSVAAAIGNTSASAVEPTTASPTIRTALVDDNYSYTFLVAESSGSCPDCWTAGDRLRIRVWGVDSDGTPDTVDLTGGGDGGLYIAQSAEEAGVEGVQVTIDLGTKQAKYESFDILIDRY